MDLIIKINLDNAAFEYQPGTELANILERSAASFWGMTDIPPLTCVIRDTNGNTVGTVEVTE